MKSLKNFLLSESSIPKEYETISKEKFDYLDKIKVGTEFTNKDKYGNILNIKIINIKGTVNKPSTYIDLSIDGEKGYG